MSSRKKRVELASLNEKLRLLAERDDENACAFDWDNLEGQCTDSWPGAPQIAAGTEALKAGNTEAALEAFQATLEHEESVTAMINKLVDLAIADDPLARQSAVEGRVAAAVGRSSSGRPGTRTYKGKARK